MGSKTRRERPQGGRGRRGQGGGPQRGDRGGGLDVRSNPLGAQRLIGNAGLKEFIKGGSRAPDVDELGDLTPSQREWILLLREVEQLNPEASVEDLAMAMSLKVWNAGQMWDENGKSQYPGLILDYQGGDGYKDVVFPEDEYGRGGKGSIHERLKRWAVDKNGESTNVNHLFPAVAAQTGRGWLSREYGSLMATSGGDTLQNLGHMLTSALDGKFGSMFQQFSSGEYAGNLRAEDIADQLREGGSLSEKLLAAFREENKQD